MKIELIFLNPYFYEFLVNFAATVIGVFLALLLQKRYERSKETKEAENIKEQLKDELKNIKKMIIDTHKREDELLLSPIKMPVFQGYVNSTKISLLDRYTWYNDLLNLYKYLDTYNDWHNLKTDKTFNNSTEKNDKSNIDSSLLTIEKISIGLKNIAEAKLSDEERIVVNSETCSLSTCVLKKKCELTPMVNGSIDCMIAKLSIKDKSDFNNK